MSVAFAAALDRTLRFEGGYIHHPNDPGGETAFGITKAVARSYGYSGSMRNLPLPLASRIYKERYWNEFGLEEIAAADPEVAAYVFDCTVNHSPRGFALICQRAVRRFHAINIDGQWGPATRGSLTQAARVAPRGLLDALRVERCRYAVEITERNPRLKAFAFGWLRRYVA